METLIPGEGGGVQVKKREETVSGVRLEPKEQTGGMVSIGPSAVKKESAVCGILGVLPAAATGLPYCGSCTISCTKRV